MDNNKHSNACRTMRVDECAAILGIGRSAMYQLVHDACNTGIPFQVIHLGGNYLVSRKSFDAFCADNGLSQEVIDRGINREKTPQEW